MTTNRAAVLAALAHHRCSAILRTENARAVRPALDAAIDGGFRVVEVTMTTPDCLQHVEALCKNKELTVGAGTVLTVEQAKQARIAGAKFMVSPVCDPQVIAFCRQHDIVSIPGTYTPTEMLQAHRSGADLVKLLEARFKPIAEMTHEFRREGFYERFPAKGQGERVARIHRELGRWAGNAPKTKG